MHAIEVYTCTFTLKPTRSLNHLLSILYNIIIVLQYYAVCVPQSYGTEWDFVQSRSGSFNKGPQGIN